MSCSAEWNQVDLSKGLPIHHESNGYDAVFCGDEGLDEKDREVRVMGSLSEDIARKNNRDERRLRARGVGSTRAFPAWPLHPRSGRHYK